MDILSFGLSVSAVGLLVVFSGLVLLILFLKAFEYLFRDRKKAKLEAAADVPALAPAAQPAPQEYPAGIAPETIAAITAAISAVWQEESGFIVRRVRRIHTAPAWNRAGRDDQAYSRL